MNRSQCSCVCERFCLRFKCFRLCVPLCRSVMWGIKAASPHRFSLSRRVMRLSGAERCDSTRREQMRQQEQLNVTQFSSKCCSYQNIPLCKMFLNKTTRVLMAVLGPLSRERRCSGSCRLVYSIPLQWGGAVQGWAGIASWRILFWSTFIILATGKQNPSGHQGFPVCDHSAESCLKFSGLVDGEKLHRITGKLSFHLLNP